MTACSEDVRFRGETGSHGQTLKMTRMTQTGHRWPTSSCDLKPISWEDVPKAMVSKPF
jgi:hypothetical protein